MTATAEIPDQPPHVSFSGARALAWNDVKAFAVSIGVLLVMFLLLQNQYWVPGGDSEVYTGAARSIAQGHGFRFNGVPVSIVPPGWSIMLAGLMKLLPEFWFLKLFTMGCMLGSLAIMYWICRRFASPGLSGLVIVLSGLISHVYSLTFWLHSDAFFCLFSSAALLLAFQVNEGRTQIWREILLVVCCLAAVSVRWAGLLSVMLVCVTLLQGQLKPRRNRLWVLAVLCGVLTLATFLAIRWAIRVSPEEQKQILEAIGAPEGVNDIASTELVITQYAWINPAKGGVLGYLGRVAGWGNWFSWLAWQPFRLGRFLTLPSLFFGWTMLLPLLLLAWQSIKSRQWIWVGVILYTFGLAINWPHPVARYLVPITPLILLGVFIGFRQLFAQNWLLPAFLIFAAAMVVAGNAPGTLWMMILKPVLIVAMLFAAFLIANLMRKRLSERSLQRICSVLLTTFVVSLVLCNGALWAVDAYVARSGDFYDRYEAGMNKDLIAACKWLNEAHPEAQVAISRRYYNMGRLRVNSELGTRIAAMLTDRSILRVPDNYVKAPGPEYVRDPRRNENFVEWARQLNVKYVLFQPKVSPWRVFHFRMAWLQARMSDDPIDDTGAGWRVYEIPPDGDAARRVQIPPAGNWPTRVPGM
jgi:hypothetical protein